VKASLADRQELANAGRTVTRFHLIEGVAGGLGQLGKVLT
jgi:hypothetical protein